MTKLFVVFGFTKLGNYPHDNDWGYANTFIQVPKVDEENIRALATTIMRANPNQFKEVCVTNFIEIKEKISGLRSFEEHNEMASKVYEMPKEIRTGVACPKCGGELINKNPGVVNASNPPSIWATCEKCQSREVIVH